MNPAEFGRWVWGRGPGARAMRAALLPLSTVYGAAIGVRTAAYRAGLLSRSSLPLPAVGVGNLTVGGSGKTPLAAWIAQYYGSRGWKPGILLRGYGGDEGLVHERLVPGAVVVADPDRVAGARRAASQGASVLVLDDAFQLLKVRRDLNVLVVGAESLEAVPWLLPAGPWRERWSALDRADVVVVTRKRVGADAAAAAADHLAARRPRVPVCVARLRLVRLEGLASGSSSSVERLAGRRVVAAAGIADPETFAAQLEALGASVQLQPYQDHQRFDTTDIAALVRAASGADYVVVTEKDAVKLRGRWPAGAAEPLVAALGVEWERNGEQMEQALGAVPRAARSPVSEF